MIIERIKSHKDFQKIKKDWNELLFSSDLNCIFLTHEWFYSWWKCFAEDNSLEILVFKKEGKPIGIAPLMARDGNLYFMASQEVTDYCDFISLEKTREEFYEKFMIYIKMNYPEIKRIELINIKDSSPSLLILSRLAPEYDWSCSYVESEVAPALVLPPSYESYVSDLSRKNRHELRRKLKRVESLRDIRVKKITETGEMETSIDTFINLHKKSNIEKEKFWEKEYMSDFFKDMVCQFSLNKWAELNLLYVKEKLVASLLNFYYLDEVYFYNMAFDPEFAWYSPGFYLFNLSIKQAISEKKTKADFLRGREEYKYHFGAKECKIYDLILTVGENQG